MKSLFASTIQRVRRFATEGPVPLRKLSNYLFTNLVNNPSLYERVKRMQVLKIGATWTEPETAPNFEWVVDFPALTLPGASLPNRVTVVGPSYAKEIDDFRKASIDLNFEFTFVDDTSFDAIAQVEASEPEMVFVRPSLLTQNSRQFSREIYNQLFESNLPCTISPLPLELRIYESKRELAYFLQAENIPHPKTRVFLNEAEAIEFAETCSLPQVFKTSTGASSSGVELLKTRRQVRSIIKRVFRSSYVRKGLGDYRDMDYGYAIFQEFVADAREYRVIKVGNSWFGHEKSKLEDQTFFSGSGVNKWTPPSMSVLDFCKDIADKHGILIATFDIFEDTSGRLLVNEIQTWFGSYNPSQMYIDDIPGRYIQPEGSNRWVFEPGYYNTNGSANLRIIELTNHIQNQKKEGGN